MSAMLAAIRARWLEWRSRHVDNERDLMQVIREKWVTR